MEKITFEKAVARATIKDFSAVATGTAMPCRVFLFHARTTGSLATGNAALAIILGSPVRPEEKHVENTLSKLGVENRAAAAALIAANQTTKRAD